MSDNPYPNASDTMHYELHTAWDEGYAEGFAAGRAAATPDPPNAEAIDALREGLTVLDRGQTVLAADMIRHAIYRLEDAPAATPDPPDGARIVAWLRGLARSDEWAPGHGISQIADEIELRFATDVDYPPVASPDERLREALERIVDLPLVDDSDADRMREIAAEALPWKPGSDDPR